MPERKVLKETLMKLKAKVIESQKTFAGLSILMNTKMNEDLQKGLEKATSMREGTEKTNYLLILNFYIVACVGYTKA